LPQLPVLQPGSPVDAKLMAAWLWSSSQVSEAVVGLSAHGFAAEPALTYLKGQALRCLCAPIGPEELLRELEGTPVSAAWDPPPADVDVVMDFGKGQPAEAAVLISLYNYGSKIERALESAAAQTTQSLELIVVDDASTDSGLATVRSWMERHHHRFVRALVLQHRHNAGLAAARNTAFFHCSATWAFVLDADNELFPGAIAACLEQAKDADPRAAVIHPLVEVIAETPEQHGERSLVSRCTWQTQAFHHGNIIDAMAFVRCNAWRDVGGYTHIEEGWEDFDFWCKLIESGWHGLLCPRVLARYHAHGTSMTASRTAHRLRSLSRCLQSRHPWLDLPHAR
jgi:GT2 family glycosyltransferase